MKKENMFKSLAMLLFFTVLFAGKSFAGQNRITAVAISAAQTGTLTYGTGASVTYAITFTCSNLANTTTDAISVTGTALPAGASATFQSGSFTVNPDGSGISVTGGQASGTISMTIATTGATVAGTTNGITVTTNFNNAVSGGTSLVVDQAPLTILPNDLTKCEGTVMSYVGDEFTLLDPMFNGDNVTSVTLSSASGDPIGATVGGGPYLIDGVDAVGTGLANYNISYSQGFLTVNTPPTVASSAGDIRCFNGFVDISASASTGTIDWYADPSGGVALLEGNNNFTTPDISVSTTYYAEANDGGCKSLTRTAVVAGVEACSKVVDVQCGTTISSTTAPVYANHVTSLTMAPTQYRFELTSVNGTTSYTSTNRYFTFADIDPAQFTYGTTYDVTLTVDRGIGTFGIVGATCQVKSPNTRILANATMPSVTSAISAASVPTATRYRFRVSDGTSTQIIVSSTNSISFARTDIATLKFNHPYTITVASEVGGMWSGYGPAATITSPTLKVVDAQCGRTINATTDILCNFITGATNYRFRLVDPSMDEQFVTSPDRAFRWSEATTLAGTAYQISVAVQINGVYTDYSTACSVSTPASMGMIVAEGENSTETAISFADLTVSTYPNPNNGTFTISTSFEGKLNIINELGQLIQSVEISKENNFKANVEGLNKGIYFVTGTSNNTVVTEKIIVQ
jgi:hypothetical protein